MTRLVMTVGWVWLAVNLAVVALIVAAFITGGIRELAHWWGNRPPSRRELRRVADDTWKSSVP